MPLIETEEASRRLARAIASDLSLYNEEKIIRGIEHDSLFEELSEEIEEGRALYKSRVSPDVSRATVQRWISEGRVKVDGNICRPKQLVRGGMRLEVEPSEPPPSTAVPDPSVEFQVLYEDAHLIVVDKPAGLVVHPARGHA